MDSIKRDLVIGIARQVYMQSVQSVMIEANTIEAVRDQLEIMAKSSLIIGEIWADAQIKYCEANKDESVIS